MKLADATTRVSFKNILFATDFSIHSSAALVYAMAIARRFESTIHAVHVISPGAYAGVPAEAVAPSYDAVMQAAKAQMRETELRMAPVQHRTAICEGDLWENISGILQEEEIDLIVMGTRGRTGLSRMLMGSVAEQIYRRATCPVLTVGPHASFCVPDEIELKKIVYATDFSPAAMAAVPYALSLAQEHEACLTLLQVVESSPNECRPNCQGAEASLRRRLLDLVPAGADSWCMPQAEIRHGDAAEHILSFASGWKANLIVLGVRKAGHPTLVPHSPGSVSSRIIAEAQCPVLTVRAV
ncbi:MAG: universal stress protein [Acidobacteriales bacterium]|nr:universal stress protein [Terriglobales bacterium]